MKLIAGLGNPGTKYEKTPHNAGFMALDLLCKKLDFEPFHEEKKFQAMLSIGQFEGEKVILTKPLTFMNLSGQAVQKILQYYKISSDDCIVIYDDLDTEFGKIRIRKNGGPGTHNGMKSVVTALGENFPRLRIGIESRSSDVIRPKNGAEFVLRPFVKEELKILQTVLQRSIKALKIMLAGDIDKAMNLYNS